MARTKPFASERQLVRVVHQLSGLLQQLAAEVREFAAAAHAVEQRAAQRGLERTDAAAEGWLGQVQRLGRTREGARVRQRKKVAQLDQRHGIRRVMVRGFA
jgi:hypothetical protein